MERIYNGIYSLLMFAPFVLITAKRDIKQIRNGVIIGVAVMLITSLAGGLFAGFFLLNTNNVKLETVDKKAADLERKVDRHGERISELERVIPAYEFRPNRLKARE